MVKQQWHCGPGGCPPHGTRRRGEALEHAILGAAVAEISEVGYDSMSMEAVAARAHTGKAALYRRWSAKEDLAVEALQCLLPPCGEMPETGSVRGDLIELLGRMAAVMTSPAGLAMQSLMGSQQCGPDMIQTVHGRVIEPRKQMMLGVLRRGAERGEVRPDAVTMLVAEVGPALIVQRILGEGPPVGRAFVEEIVDQVVMPLLRPLTTGP